ncbi:MAG: hypothetical protein ACRDJW_13180, partial [Thermomicrobiales bacterium]
IRPRPGTIPCACVEAVPRSKGILHAFAAWAGRRCAAHAGAAGVRGVAAGRAPDSGSDRVRLAYQSDATVEIVRTEVSISTEELIHIPEADSERPRADAAKRLDEPGGVGAVLRFALSGDQATAEM